MCPQDEPSEADELKDENTSCACNDTERNDSLNHVNEDSCCENEHEQDREYEVSEEEQFEELFGTSGTKKITFHLAGMDCANCALSLQKALSKVDGVSKSTTVSFGPRITKLVFDGEKETFERVEKKIRELGYELEGERIIFNLENLSSRSLGKRLEKELGDVSGVLYADVSFKQKTITLIYNPSEINLQKIKSEIQKLGVTIVGEKKTAKISKQKIKLLQTAVTGTFFALGWATGWIFNTYGTTSLFLPSIIFLLSAVVIGGYSTVLKAFYSLRSKVLDVNTLVTIAVIGAIVIGEYWEASAVVFLFLFGSLLESLSMEKTRNAIRELIDLKPKVARVRRYETEVEVLADEVKKGEIVIVKAGEKLPVDGVIIKGSTAVNQSSVTGESIPVEKTIGDGVFSSTINADGYIEIETTKTGIDTTLSKIIKMVEKAQTEKAPLQTFAEKFDKYYVPAVILIAIINFLITQNLLVTLTLLVVACPCALVISTPVAIVSGIGNAARKGVLVKGGRSLETLGKLEAIAFDKTGTITLGKIKVFEIDSFHDDVPIKDVLYWAGIGEKMAEHQIGKAIVEHVQAENIIIPKDAPDKLSVISGIGVIAEYNSRRIIMGKRKLLEDNGLIFSKEIDRYLQKAEIKGYTVIPIGVDDRVIGAISVADLLKPEAPEALSKLKKVGIKQIFMLTGDNERAAETIAKCMEIDVFKANLLPEDKVSYVKQLREEGHVVGMVGDGINDAPALAAADIGIAMGAAGTDVAIETADIALMSDDISKVPYAIGLSKKTNAIIRQNITFALVIVFALLIATLFGIVELASGILGHEASALLVILNGMRLLRYK
ncbi:MAG: cadmium-translocating P-type ATPase [Candidatus Lokiarchaeota archaeon]|nr:cadmium-translocating P-type ATPase [Candidatus Lokiarchaeota archaeon]